MGQKLYEESKDGGMCFISHRKGEVRIPNYVYDIWMPIIGSNGIAVYSTYCRLEREGTVKAITQRRLAKSLRIGGETLKKTNKLLEECGFIKVYVPQGYERTMHWTTKIEIFDPPQKVDKELIDKYAVGSGYEPLSTWLVKTEEEQENESLNTTQCFHKTLPSVSNIESLDIESLDLKDSPEPKKRKPRTDEHALMVKALEEATGMDMAIKTNAGIIVRASKELREAGYTHKDVIEFKRKWRQDWRYQKDGSLPSVMIIKREIEHTKTSEEEQAERLKIAQDILAGKEVKTEKVDEAAVRRKKVLDELRAQGINPDDYSFLRKD